jgi:hypothetical protein
VPFWRCRAFPRNTGERHTTATAARPFAPAIRVTNAVAHFAACLPFRVRCSDDLSVGLEWAERDVALRRLEIAPDPPGWKTALRFDVDCPCDRRPHGKSGYCPRAATYWRDVMLAEPSCIVVNPANGHAHYVYLLRGWLRVDGAAAEDLPAVRYYAAIERAYTRALRADAGYAGLVQHNPFAATYETLNGRDDPYSLGELAAHVELPPIAPRCKSGIRTDGRNVETFDRLRFWAYAQIGEFRCGLRETWDDVVSNRALAIAEEVRAAHAQATHPYSDAEALDTAKSVAGWVWLRYDGGQLTRVRSDTAVRRETDRKRAILARRTRGAVPRDVYLAAAQERRLAASTLRRLGVSIVDIARRLSAGVRSVQRWLSELDPLVRSAPGPSVPSDFACRSIKQATSPSVSPVPNNGIVRPVPRTPERAAIAAAIDGSGAGAPSGTDGSGDKRTNDQPGRGVRGETGPMAYIRRRIAAIVSRGSDARPP